MDKQTLKKLFTALGVAAFVCLLIASGDPLIAVFYSIVALCLWALGKYLGWQWVLGGAIVLVFGVYFVSENVGKRSEEAPTTEESYQPEREVYEGFYSAGEIMRDYKANEVRADQMYKGKLIRVYGYVRDIKRDVLGRIYVTLQPKLNYNVLEGVQCYFNEEHADQAAGFNIGQELTLEGRGGPSTIFQPTLQECHKP